MDRTKSVWRALKLFGGFDGSSIGSNRKCWCLQPGDPLDEAASCGRRVLVLLQHVDALGGGGLVVAPHVVVHLRETLLHVILGAALPHRPKPEAQGGMVQLRRRRRRGGRGFTVEVAFYASSPRTPRGGGGSGI